VPEFYKDVYIIKKNIYGFFLKLKYFILGDFKENLIEDSLRCSESFLGLGKTVLIFKFE